MQHLSLTLPLLHRRPASRRRGLIVAPLLLLLAAFISFWPQPTQAQTDYNVKMTSRSLFDGAFKFGDWLPIEITLENYGTAVNVQVEATVTNQFNGAPYDNTFKRPISLGEKSNKRFYFYIQPYVRNNNVSRNVYDELKVTLKTGDGTNRQLNQQIVKLLPVSPGDYLVGAINSQPIVLSGLNNLKVGPNLGRVTVYNIAPNDFPDRAEGLRSFDSLVLSEVNTASLNSEQLAALKGWVAQGGQLLLMGGNGWNKVRAGFNTDMLPFTSTSLTKLNNLDALLTPGSTSSLKLTTDVTISVAEALQGAAPLVTTADPQNPSQTLPLLVERKIGAGRVVGLAMDIAVNPLAENDNIGRVWQDLFNFNAGIYYPLYAEPNPQLKNNSEFFGLMSSVPEVQLPNIWPFFILFAVYILVVSPVNYLILRQFKRPVLAWVTIPAFGILFTAGAVWLGGQQPPGEIILNQATIIEGSSTQDSVQIRSFVTAFASEDRQYNIQPVINSTSTPLLVPLNRTGTYNTINDSEPPRTIIEGDQPQMQNFKIGQWSAQGFLMETTQSDRAFQLQSNLSFKDGKIVGTIKNNTGYAIRNVMLALGENIVKVKDIEPGENYAVEFDMGNPTNMTAAYCSSSGTNYSQYNNTGGISEKLAAVLRGDKRNDRVLEYRSEFLKKLYDSGRYGINSSMRGLDLIGWLDSNPLPLVVEGRSATPKSNQVLLYRLSVSNEAQAGDGRLVEPGAYFQPGTPRNEINLASLTSRAERTDQICANRAPIVTEYQLPIASGSFKPTKFTFYINSFTSNGARQPRMPDRVEMYDWQKKAWVEISGLSNTATVAQNSATLNQSTPQPNDISNPARFANPDTGKILVRFTNGTASAIGLIIQHALTVEGTR